MNGQHRGTVVVVGQGYVGLPVAMRAVEMGYRVVGLDIDERRVSQLRAGDSYVGDISSEELRAALDSRLYEPSTSYSDAAGFDFAVVTVPTPLKESLPDLSFIEESARRLAPHVTPGATIVLESTTYPGTTEELFAPLLESDGLVAGSDFHVGYSPERIDPGNPKFGFVSTPKVVSGLTQACLDKVQGFYDTLIDTTVPVGSPKEAELTKLLENTFRHVNIALVNELAIFAHQLGIDIWESIDAASTKPFGYMRFTPGPGVGGHCLPVDPSYLSWQVKKQLGQNFRFVELANDVNEHMPQYVVNRIIKILNDDLKSVRGSRILLVGLAYKANTGDIRESPSLKLIELLDGLGAELLAVDDLIEDHRWPEGVKKVQLTAELLDSVDLSVLVTPHSRVDYRLLESPSRRVLDTQNRLRGERVQQL